MREPEPTPADQWSTWETDPTLPTYWPGLGTEQRQGGFEIDRRGVRAASRKLIGLAAGITSYAYVHEGAGLPPDIHWTLPRDLGALFKAADEAVHMFWQDLYAEVGMAGMLLEKTSARYDLADNPPLGDIPISELDQRIHEMLPGDPPSSIVKEPSSLYPNGSVSLMLPAGAHYGVDHMTAEKAIEDLGYFSYGSSGEPTTYAHRADALVELANVLLLRAQDLRDSPWRGDVADTAQIALRQIYGNATALAAITGKLDAATRRFEEITDWCVKNFEPMADPHRGDWSEFWDFGGTADSRTRSFLAQANNEFLGVYGMLPTVIKEDLPGLLVTDAGLAELRERVHNVESRPKDSEFLKENDPDWLEQYRPILSGYEQAEKQYG